MKKRTIPKICQFHKWSKICTKLLRLYADISFTEKLSADKSAEKKKAFCQLMSNCCCLVWQSFAISWNVSIKCFSSKLSIFGVLQIVWRGGGGGKYIRAKINGSNLKYLKLTTSLYYTIWNLKLDQFSRFLDETALQASSFAPFQTQTIHICIYTYVRMYVINHLSEAFTFYEY